MNKRVAIGPRKQLELYLELLGDIDDIDETSESQAALIERCIRLAELVLLMRTIYPDSGA